MPLRYLFSKLCIFILHVYSKICCSAILFVSFQLSYFIKRLVDYSQNLLQLCSDRVPLCHNILLLLLPFNFIFYIVTTETYILLTPPTNFSSDRRFSKEVCCNASSNVNWTLKRLLLSKRLDT